MKTSRLLLWICCALIAILALAIRFYDFGDTLLDFNSTRQLHSALIARGMYYQQLPSAPQWQREMALRLREKEGLIEPPVMEFLTAQTYHLLGEETLLVARFYSILFWIAGSIFLFLTSRRISGGWCSLAAILYYLILPFGAIASRAFMPDPLMTAATIAAYWGMLQWQQHRSWRWTVIAGLLAGFAIFIKAVAVFFIAGAWVGLLLGSQGIRRILTDRRVWSLAVLTVLPYLVFHIYGVYISGALASQFNLRFFPQLWRDPVFYLQWKGQISGTLGLEWCLIALIASSFVQERSHRAMLLGIWAGYFVYGMTLPFHISTHDYYQLPLIPVVALGLAAAVNGACKCFQSPKWLTCTLLGAVMVFLTVINAWEVRVALKRYDFSQEPVYWQKLGQQIGQGKAVVGLMQDYGYRLSYWGWVESDQWMSSGDFNYRRLAGLEYDMDSLFAELTTGKDYFVVTAHDELERQPELKSLLYNRYPLLPIDGDALVFDLHHPMTP